MRGIIVCELRAQLFLNGATHEEMCEGEMSFRVILHATSLRVVHLAWLEMLSSSIVLCCVSSRQTIPVICAGFCTWCSQAW